MRMHNIRKIVQAVEAKTSQGAFMMQVWRE